MQNSDYNKTIKFGTLTQLACFLLKLIEMLWTYKKWQKLELEGEWTKLGPKLCLLRQFRTKYLGQSEVIQ